MKLNHLVLLFSVADCRSLDDLRVEALNGGMKLINTCPSTVKRLKKEPEDHVEIVAKGKTFVDKDFYRRE